VDQVVERVFLGKEILQRSIAPQHGLVKKSDIPTRTEGAKWLLLAHAPDSHCLHLRIFTPGLQRFSQRHAPSANQGH